LILYTYHPQEFDLVSNATNPLLYSTYMSWGDDFVNAYKWLFENLGTSKIIWCYDHETNSGRHGCIRRKWVLDVPENQILATIDSHIWAYIINGWHYSEEANKFWLESEELYPNDCDDQYEYYNKKIKELEKSISKEDLWKIAFESKSDAMEYIIPSPIKKEWVMEVCDLSIYDREYAAFGNISNQENEDIELFQKITESFLNGKKLKYNKNIIETDKIQYTILK